MPKRAGLRAKKYLNKNTHVFSHHFGMTSHNCLCLLNELTEQYEVTRSDVYLYNEFLVNIVLKDYAFNVSFSLLDKTILKYKCGTRIWLFEPTSALLGITSACSVVPARSGTCVCCAYC